MSGAVARKGGLLDGVRRAFGLARDEIATARADVERLRSEIELEASRPVSPATIEARVDATLDHLRAHAHDRLDDLARPGQSRPDRDEESEEEERGSPGRRDPGRTADTTSSHGCVPSRTVL